MEALKKFWHWLKMKDENGNVLDAVKKEIPLANSIPNFIAFKYSDLTKDFPIHGKIGKEDIIQLSHKLENGGGYETCYVTVKQLKDAILEMT